MKIFFACHRFPFPPNRGGKIRPFNMIRHLSQKHEVFVGSLAHTQKELDEGAGLREYCAEIYDDVVPEKRRWLQAVRVLPGAASSSVAYFGSSRLRQKVMEAAQRITFDAVMVHCAFAAQYGLDIPAKFRMIDFGDLDSGKWQDYSEWCSFPLRLAYRLEAFKLRRYEQRAAAAFDYCTLTTEGELEEFKKLQIDRPHSVIPNGVDSSYFHTTGRQPQERPVIAFLGRMDYYPNIDGILFFTKRILPLIRSRIPAVELRIIGADPARDVRRLGMLPGVLVTGYVADVRPYLIDAALSVAPLRMARGTQNKILESMSMGIPVVASPVAAKGIQAVPNEHLLIGETPESFAEQVIRVLQDPTLGNTLAHAGRKRVNEAHDWAVSMRTLDDILNSRGSL